MSDSEREPEGVAGPDLLSVRRLQVRHGSVLAVEDVSLAVGRGQRVGIVGESGSGKSQTLLAVAGLVDPPGTVRADEMRLGDLDLLHLSRARRRDILGTRISMVLQDPLAALSPVWTVGEQVAETLRRHHGASRREARAQAIEALAAVGIPDPVGRARAYPHHLSGGMRQRVAIAVALSCRPDLLLADEPTTALDASIAAQILDLLVGLSHDLGTALVLVTHDLGALARVVDTVAVMYAGRIVEVGPLTVVRARPRHPYTQALLRSAPRLDPRRDRARLPSIPGLPPRPDARPPGCPFHPRCEQAIDLCRRERPPLIEVGDGVAAACHLVPQPSAAAHIPGTATADDRVAPA